MHFWVIQWDMLNLDRFIQMWDSKFQSIMCGCVIVGLFLFGHCLDSIFISTVAQKPLISYCTLCFIFAPHFCETQSSSPHGSWEPRGGCHGGFPQQDLIQMMVEDFEADLDGPLSRAGGDSFRWSSRFCFALQRVETVFLRCKASVIVVCDSTRMKPWYIQPSSFSGCWLDLPMEHN